MPCLSEIGLPFEYVQKYSNAFHSDSNLQV